MPTRREPDLTWHYVRQGIRQHSLNWQRGSINSTLAAMPMVMIPVCSSRSRRCLPKGKEKQDEIKKWIVEEHQA
jgi:hypothetical protein